MVPAPFSVPASLLMSEPTMVPAPAEPEQMFQCRCRIWRNPRNTAPTRNHCWYRPRTASIITGSLAWLVEFFLKCNLKRNGRLCKTRRVGWYQYFLVPVPKFPMAQNSWFRFQWCQRCRHQLSYRHYHLGWHHYWSWYQHCIGVMAQSGFISKWCLALLAYFEGKGSGSFRYLEVSSLLAICYLYLHFLDKSFIG